MQSSVLLLNIFTVLPENFKHILKLNGEKKKKRKRKKENKEEKKSQKRKRLNLHILVNTKTATTRQPFSSMAVQ